MGAQKCPVCDWEVKDGGHAVEAGGKKLVVCCAECAQEAAQTPGKYIHK
jgi:hypothetical protein